MIRSFADRNTARLFGREHVNQFPDAVQRTMLRKLVTLDAAETLDDLRVPPGNRLEKLTEDREGQYSIRVNDRWRVCFPWQSRFDLESERDRLGKRLEKEVIVFREAS